MLLGEYFAHIKRMRIKLLGEKRGSKRWWKIANEIMDVSSSSAAIPALKSGDLWAYSPEEKANLFADCFASKFAIPRRETNEHSIEWPRRVSGRSVVVNAQDAARCLEALDEDSGTGPDGLASRVVKRCAHQLSVPLAKLIQRILTQGFWPSSWTVH